MRLRHKTFINNHFYLRLKLYKALLKLHFQMASYTVLNILLCTFSRLLRHQRGGGTISQLRQSTQL